MGRYSVPRPVRYGFGILVGASVFAATSVAMFSLAASAGNSTDLLGGLTNTVGTVTGGVVNTVSNTVNNVAGPSGTVCQLLCNVGSSGATQPQNSNPINNTLTCVTAGNCSSVTNPLPSTNHSTNGSNNGSTSPGGNTTVPPVSNPGPVISAPVGRGSGANDPPALAAPSGVQAPGSLVPPPPSSINLPTATSGINFGKAPFLWPLFLGLDVLGAGAVVLALRKTWSRPVAD